MSTTKTKAEPQNKVGPAPTTEKQPEPPEKKTGLMQAVLVQRAGGALPPPNGKPAAARAGALLSEPPTGPGAPGRARISAGIQRSVGNARINRMLGTSQTTPVPSNASISVSRSPGMPQLLQRKCACGGEAGPDDECAACKTARMVVQRQANAPTASDALPPSVTGALQSSAGQPLQVANRALMESAFGTDLGDVRIHTGAQAETAAHDINAKAFTRGQNIYFAAGQYQPGTQTGNKLLAHELTHTVQQSNGQVTVQSRDAISQPSEPQEQEAESVAAQVTASLAIEPTTASSQRVLSYLNGHSSLIQRQTDTGTDAKTADADDSSVSDSAPLEGNQGDVRSPALSPEDTRRLIVARTTLSKVKPMSQGDKETLAKAIPGAAAVKAIKERDQKRDLLKQTNDKLVILKPEHGLPDNTLAAQLQALSDQIDALTKEIQVLNDSINEMLNSLAITQGDLGDREQKLVSLVTKDFPAIFVARAKEIAKNELEENKQLAEQEAVRYKDVCTETEDGPAARQGLRIAATDLSNQQSEIARLKNELEKAKTQLPIAGVDEAAQARVDDLSTQLNDKQTKYTQNRRAYSLKFPILLRDDMDVAALAAVDDKKLIALVGEQVQDVIDDINDSEENIDDETIKVWNLIDPKTGFDIVSITKQDMGIEGDPLLEQVLTQHIADAKSDEAALEMLFGAIALTATIIATAAGGPIAGALVGGSFGVIQLSQDVKKYLAQSAINDVALDPELAKMSQEEPSIFWIVLDIVGVILDLSAAKSAITAMRPAARKLISGGAVAEFAEEAKKLAPQAYERLAASAERQVASRKLVGRVGTFADEAAHAAGTERIAARRFTKSGHELEVTAEGLARLCSPRPCPVLRTQFADELTKNKALQEELAKAEALAKANPEAAADAILKVEAKLVAERAHNLVGPALFGKLQKLGLEGEAIERILAKGSDLGNVKGRLFDELFSIEAKKMAATTVGKKTLAGGKLLSEEVLAKAEFWPGSEIRDIHGAELSDGIFGWLEGDKLHVINVFEAKAGQRVSVELRLIEQRMDRIAITDLAEVRKLAEDTFKDLQAKAQKAGKSMDITVDQIEQGLLKYRVQKQIGGQVRETIERLDYAVDLKGSGNIPTRIKVGRPDSEKIVNVVDVSGSTRVTGVVPSDVKTAGLKKVLEKEQLNFDVLPMGIKQAEMDALAKEISDAAKASGK